MKFLYNCFDFAFFNAYNAIGNTFTVAFSKAIDNVNHPALKFTDITNVTGLSVSNNSDFVS